MNSEILIVGDMTINQFCRTVHIDDTLISLTSNDFDLLWKLALRVNQTVSRDELFRDLLNTDYDGLDRCIDIRISRLRKKLEDNGRQPCIIKSIRSEGYRLVEANHLTP
ncbi:MAG: hypothetical protein GY841_19950 [FCB group bacterium]|nr:hypothetical protein [FCB group bacterium]